MAFRNKVALVTNSSPDTGRTVTLKLAPEETDVMSLKTVEGSIV